MRNKIIAYVLHFTSFLMESGIEPKKVILFGSIVTGKFDKESDVDIFIDTDKQEEKKVMSILKTFNSTYGEKWKLKGITNPISIKIGRLDARHELKRSMQSYGILLYGKYNEFPDNMNSYLLFRLDFGRASRSNKVMFWRRLYGYSQKIGKKKYESKGIIKSLGGQKIEKSVVIIPMDKSGQFKDFLIKNKIQFIVNEIWTDNL